MLVLLFKASVSLVVFFLGALHIENRILKYQTIIMSIFPFKSQFLLHVFKVLLMGTCTFLVVLSS